MNTSELIEMVARQTKLPASSVKKIFAATAKCVKESAVKGDCVKIANFGSVKLKERKARRCINPQTGRSFFCPAKKVICVKLSKNFEKVT